MFIVPFGVFATVLVVLALWVRSIYFTTAAANQSNPAVREVPRGFEPAPDLTLGDNVLIDISSRYNEAVVANIDAVDTALIAILALPVAFAVFTTDKIKDLSTTYEWLAILLLLSSAGASFLGYTWGFLVRGGRHGTQDGIVPSRFLGDYMKTGPSAVADSIREINVAGAQNARIRQLKRTFAVAALMLFLVGAATVVVARLSGKDWQDGPTVVRIHFE